MYSSSFDTFYVIIARCVDIYAGLSTPHAFKGIIDDVKTHGTLRHLCKKYSLTPIVENLRWHKTRKKDVNIVTFDLIGLLPTNHIIA